MTGTNTAGVMMPAMAENEERGPTPEELAPWTVKENYVPVLGVPPEPWRIDANWEDGYFRAAKLVVGKVVDPAFESRYMAMPGIEGIAGVYLFRHYLELALKHILFHSRWLRHQSTNEHWNEVKDVAKTHSLQRLWNTITKERIGKIPDEFWDSHDIDFVTACITEFHSVDQNGETFRYHGPAFGVIQGPPVVNQLYIAFDRLLAQMDHVRDVLWSLDAYCLNTHGLNEEWEDILKSF
jgi:hypothetical protein